MRRIFSLTCLTLLALSVGCSHYEYDIVRPPAFAQHVGEKQNVRFRLDPLDYDFVSYENYLVIRISNPNEVPIRLLADRSYVVDPNGQSHPVRGQTIAPGSYIKLILPPIRPRLESDGPRIGFGLGVIAGGPPGRPYYGPYGRRASSDFYFEDGFYDEPRYYTVYDGSDFYWNWKNEGDAQLSLYFIREKQRLPDTQPALEPPTLQPDGIPIVHTFDLHRRKM